MKKFLRTMMLALSVSFLAACGGGGGGGDDGPGASGENTTALSGNYVNTIGASEDRGVIYAKTSNDGGITFSAANEYGELYSGTGTLLANGTITVLYLSSVSGTTTQPSRFDGTGTIVGSTMTITGKSNIPGDSTQTFTLNKTTSKIPGVFNGTSGTGTATSGASQLVVGIDFDGVSTGNTYKTDVDPFTGTVNLSTGVFTGASGTTTMTGYIDPSVGTTITGDWTDPETGFGKYIATRW